MVVLVDDVEELDEADVDELEEDVEEDVGLLRVELEEVADDLVVEDVEELELVEEDEDEPKAMLKLVPSVEIADGIACTASDWVTIVISCTEPPNELTRPRHAIDGGVVGRSHTGTVESEKDRAKISQRQD